MSGSGEKDSKTWLKIEQMKEFFGVQQEHLNDRDNVVETHTLTSVKKKKDCELF